MEVVIQGNQRDFNEEEDDGEGALLIEGEEPEAVRTIFVDDLPEDFEKDALNALAVAKAFDWQKVLEWKRREEDFNHNDSELGTIVTAESGMRQIFSKHPKVKTQEIILNESTKIYKINFV